MKEVNSIGEEEASGMTTGTLFLSEIARKSLFILIITVISLFLISEVSAIEFSFDYPKNIEVDEEFSITINFETNEVYDIKAYVHDDNKEYSEIYDGSKWATPYYFLKEAFPASKQFKLIAHQAAETKICVKLRKTGSKTAAGEVCNDITVGESSSSNSNNQQNQQTSNQQNNNKEPLEEPIKEEVKVENKIISTPSQIENEKIVLNYAETVSETYMTKQEKVRLGVIYGFAGICVLIIFLLALKKL